MRTIALALILSAACAQARAQDKDAVRIPATTTSLSLDVTTHYFYRGLPQEDSGVIAQPAIEIGGPILEGDGVLRSANWRMGLWNSLHTHDSGSGAAGPSSAWYESDFYFAVDTALPNDLSLEASYVALHSPNGRFATTEEVVLTVRLDDASYHGGSAFGGFAPHVTVAFETDGGSDAGTNLGTYAEVGIEPTLCLANDVVLAAPITAGFSVSDYYENAANSDERLGFVSVKLETRMPARWLSALGPWDLSVGIELLYLGDNNRALNGGDRFEVIGTMGFSLDL